MVFKLQVNPQPIMSSGVADRGTTVMMVGIYDWLPEHIPGRIAGHSGMDTYRGHGTLEGMEKE
jgi:hypothetical protein